MNRVDNPRVSFLARHRTKTNADFRCGELWKIRNNTTDAEEDLRRGGNRPRFLQRLVNELGERTDCSGNFFLDLRHNKAFSPISQHRLVKNGHLPMQLRVPLLLYNIKHTNYSDGFLITCRFQSLCLAQIFQVKLRKWCWMLCERVDFNSLQLNILER